MSTPPNSTPSRSMANMIVRYDLEKMKEEVKADFSPEAGSHRLLKQSDISKRFQRKSRPTPPKTDPES